MAGQGPNVAPVGGGPPLMGIDAFTAQERPRHPAPFVFAGVPPIAVVPVQPTATFLNGTHRSALAQAARGYQFVQAGLIGASSPFSAAIAQVVWHWNTQVFPGYTPTGGGSGLARGIARGIARGVVSGVVTN